MYRINEALELNPLSLSEPTLRFSVGDLQASVNHLKGADLPGILRPGVHEVQKHSEVMLASFQKWIKRCIQFDFLLPIAYTKRGLKLKDGRNRLPTGSRYHSLLVSIVVSI